MRRAVLALALVIACSSPPPSSPPPTPVVIPDAGVPVDADVPSPARVEKWIPSERFVDLGDGRRGAVARGRRVIVDRAGTATVVDAEAITGLGRPYHVPDPLGGGWVFVGYDDLWTSRTFDGPLVDFQVPPRGLLGFGADMIFANHATYDLVTGKPVPPPVQDLEWLVCRPSGEVAAQTKKGDVYFSKGKGKPFKLVGKGLGPLGSDPRGFAIRTGDGPRILSADGKLGPTTMPMPNYGSGDLFGRWELDFGRAPATADRLVETTASMDDGHVLRVADKDVEVFDGKSGALLATLRDPFAPHYPCRSLRGGTPAFVYCGSAKLFRFDAFDRPPALEDSPSIPKVMGYPAPGTPLAGRGASPNTLVVRRDETTWIDVTFQDPENVIPKLTSLTVMATAQGVPYAYGWKEADHVLIVFDGASRTVRTIAKSSFPRWVAENLYGETASASGGKMRFLVAGDHPGVATIDGNGKVESKPLAGHLAAVGSHGLLVSPNGDISETIDGGQTWHGVESPPGGADPSVLQCSEAACEVGPWIRLVWRR